ncbi:hypothetical protein QYM46_13075 [Brevibacterium sp. K11IcPPYGO002]|uniref:hypothetical protein n=1 Tax=Brevibacterium sp. K11IcPPYGO002 TaxID=3058837 RepID=UPI003D81A0F1
MSTVDEILASGRYTDKRGRGWDYVETVASWCSPVIDGEGVSWGYRYLDEAQMRLLIERDKHRDVCRGLPHCGTHPVPAVVSWTTPIGYPQYGAHWRGRHHYTSTLSEAMDAARALAVGE